MGIKEYLAALAGLFVPRNATNVTSSNKTIYGQRSSELGIANFSGTPGNVKTYRTSSFVAPSDGVVLLWFHPRSTTATHINLNVRGYTIANVIGATSVGNYLLTAYVKKGDTVSRDQHIEPDNANFQLVPIE